MRYLSLFCVAYLFAGCDRPAPARPFAITKTEAIESRPATPHEPVKGVVKLPLADAERDLSILACACKIKATKSSGVNTASGVLTCWHCVEKHAAGPIEVTCGDETMTGTVVVYDIPNDIAVIAVPWKMPHPVAEISTSYSVKTGDSVRSAGRLRHGRLGVDGYKVVASSFLGTDTIYTDNPFVGGQSGSGLFNSAGKLIGIAKAVDMTDEPYRGMSTSIGPINSLLKSIRVAPAPPAESPREKRKRRRAIIGTASWCGSCRAFHDMNLIGNVDIELVYVDIEKSRQPEVTQEEWDRVVSIARGMYGPNVEQQLPFAMWHADNGKWYSKTVAGWKTTELEKWVN